MINQNEKANKRVIGQKCVEQNTFWPYKGNDLFVLLSCMDLHIQISRNSTHHPAKNDNHFALNLNY